jgi:hypothetical protein
MDDLLDDLTRALRRCEQTAQTIKVGPFAAIGERIQEQVKAADLAWSHSWIGYHARIYIRNLEPAGPRERFDSEWGLQPAIGNATLGRWVVHDEGAVKAEILRRARVSDADLKLLDETASQARVVFDEVKEELLPTLDAVLAAKEDATIRRVRDEIEKSRSCTSEQEIVSMFMPKNQLSRDSSAIAEGPKVAPHLQLEAKLLFQMSGGMQLIDLAKSARYLVTYMQKGMKMTGKSVARTDGKIFIGHGRSPIWRDLKDFVSERLGLTWDEFNRESTAGKSNKERLESMLDNAVFAFLVMTAEDQMADGSKQARSNVIHEAGLFQGRLGFERAIILLEDGCEEFSNVEGITQIRFPAGKIGAQFEEVRRVLERENVLRK